MPEFSLLFDQMALFFWNGVVQLTKYRTLLKLSAHNFDFLFPNGRFIDQAKTKATINSSSVLENEQAWKHGCEKTEFTCPPKGFLVRSTFHDILHFMHMTHWHLFCSSHLPWSGSSLKTIMT
jgi:hypothetical protein